MDMNRPSAPYSSRSERSHLDYYNSNGGPNIQPSSNMSQEQPIRGNKYPRARREQTEDERNLIYKHPEAQDEVFVIDRQNQSRTSSPRQKQNRTPAAEEFSLDPKRVDPTPPQLNRGQSIEESKDNYSRRSSQARPSQYSYDQEENKEYPDSSDQYFPYPEAQKKPEDFKLPFKIYRP